MFAYGRGKLYKETIISKIKKEGRRTWLRPLPLSNRRRSKETNPLKDKNKTQLCRAMIQHGRKNSRQNIRIISLGPTTFV